MGFFIFVASMKATISFLKDLSQNNNREWFTDNKKKFEEAKAEFEDFVAECIGKVSLWDESVRDLKPKDCIYRIYRDVRFSKDKTPYKTNFGALIGKDGRKGKGSINYLQIQPNESFTAGGMYLPESADLKAIRQEIDYNLGEFEAILNKKDFKEHFGNLSQEWKLKTVPKGYDKENPAIEYLKLKGFVVMKKHTDKEVLASGFSTTVANSFELVKPLNTFLNRAIAGE